MTARVRVPVVVAVLAIAFASCSAPAGRDARVPQVLVGSDSLDLANATYMHIMEAAGPVTLSAGRWEGVPADSAAASRPEARLLVPLSPQGDLDGDGTPEAVAMLAASGGGSGSSLYAAVVARRDGRWRNVATVWVGDRVAVRDARADSGRVTLDVVQAGEADAMCCPADLVTRRWLLQGDSLAEQSPVRTGRLSPAVLEGSEWVLREWSAGEPAAAEPEVTLACAGDRWSGSSGCNRYSVQVTPGDTPGDVRLGPAAVTRRACPAPEEAIEARFLQALGGVTRMGFVAGRLVLSHPAGAGTATLVFERRPGTR